jgi:hypothetical protein
MLNAPSPSRNRRAWPLRESSITKFLAIFLLWWALTVIIYSRIESNFLRAESGLYLLVSKSPPAIQKDFLRKSTRSTYSGHYTPIAFVAEFGTAKLVGAMPVFWKWRQITVVALLATVLYSLVRDSCRLSSLAPGKSVATAVAATALLVFQPYMTDFIAWPFMILQLLWLVFTSSALFCLIKIVERPANARWRWLAVSAAYASLNVLGLGITTVAATATVLAGLLFWEYRSQRSKRLAIPLVVLLGVSALHGFFMLVLPHAETIPFRERFPHLLSGAFGFVPSFAAAAFRALFSSHLVSIDGLQLWPDWPYGLAFVAIMIASITAVFLRTLRNPQSTSAQRGTFVLATFAAVSFIALVGLISARELTHPSPNGYGDYFIGSRYLIPAQFTFLGFLILLFIRVNAVPFMVSVLMNFFLLFSAIAGNAQFRKNVYPKVAPKSVISHARAWQSIVAMASECQKASLAIPNAPLGVLTQEFSDWDLKLFEPLLRSELKITTETPLEFIPWDRVSNQPPEEYAKNVPALREVKQILTVR